MHKQGKMRTTVALIMAICMGVLPAFVHAAGDAYEQQANERSAGAMAIDAIVVRPLGMIATVLGSAVFAVSLPFSALGGNVGQAANTLVVAPAKFTFTRPLGEYDSYR